MPAKEGTEGSELCLGKLTDIAECMAVGIQVELHEDYVKIWLCVDGQCRLRIMEAKNLDVSIPGHPDFRFGKGLD